MKFKARTIQKHTRTGNLDNQPPAKSVANAPQHKVEDRPSARIIYRLQYSVKPANTRSTTN